MESYFVPTSIDISETGRQNSILAIRAHLEIIESVPLWVAPNIVMTKVTKAKQTKHNPLCI
jgi:hypothetical protein